MKTITVDGAPMDEVCVSRHAPDLTERSGVRVHGVPVSIVRQVVN